MSRTADEDAAAYYAEFEKVQRRCDCPHCAVIRAEEAERATRTETWRDASGALHPGAYPGGMMVHSINCSMARRGGLCDCGVQLAADKMRENAAQAAWNEHLSDRIAAGEKMMEYVREHPAAQDAIDDWAPIARTRKSPVATGCLDYFPDALLAVAATSAAGSAQHGTSGWDRSKSTDEANALVRHFLKRGTLDTDGIRHSAKVAWRALALLQKEIEAAQ